MNRTPARYDLLACNLVLASIAALLMAAMGSSVKVVQILEGVSIAGFDINLGLGAAVNPGVLVASLVIFFSMTAALLCVIHNRLSDRTFGRTLTSVASWLARPCPKSNFSPEKARHGLSSSSHFGTIGIVP